MHRQYQPSLHSLQFPKQLTPFVDRKEELLALNQLLAEPTCRLLTIVGPGGIGKTRLAVAAAAQQDQWLQDEAEDAFLHGIFFVNVQPLRSAERLAWAITEAVGCPMPSSEPPQTQLFNYLSNKALLLVLDSFDELLAADPNEANEALTFLTDLLQAAPHSKLLVTSREALNLQEEWLYPLAGLSYPTVTAPHAAEELTLAELEAYSAVQLFVQCARRVRPDFSLAQEQAGVVRICRLVEGLPLALELAASWVKSLDCAAIASEIERSLSFLATSVRNVPERHRSMHAVFDQTWRMLSEEERNVFQRLAVFRGGFRRRAAEAVAGASLPVLSTLVNKSLLRWEPNGRYQIHELLRQFADAQLQAQPEVAAATQDAHAAYYAAFLQRRAAEVTAHRQREVVLEIGAELENLRSAWAHAVAHGQVDRIKQAAYTFYQYCDMQGRFQESFEWLQAALKLFPMTPSTPETWQIEAELRTLQGWNHIRLGDFAAAGASLTRAQSLWAEVGREIHHGFGTDPALAVALLATVQGDYAKAITVAEAACARHTAREDWLNAQLAHFVLASAYLEQGNVAAARPHAQHGYRLTKESGNRWMMAYMLKLLGECSRLLGDFEAARQSYQQCYFVREEFNDPEGMAVALNYLGKTAGLRQDYAEAKRAYERSLTIYRHINDRGGLATTLRGLGEIALYQREYGQAQPYLHDALQLAAEIAWRPLILTVLGTAAQLLHAWGCGEQAVELLTLVSTHPASTGETRALAEELLRGYTKELPASQAARLRAETLDLSTATSATLAALALQPTTTPAQHAGTRRATVDQPLVEPLTSRELEVLQLIAAGLSNQQIADQLILSVGTVKFYTGQIYGKLGVNSRTQAIAQARMLSLLPN
jgi:predicted ATPase/DNA-binding CsgD family transcriptional regulator